MRMKMGYCRKSHLTKCNKILNFVTLKIGVPILQFLWTMLLTFLLSLANLPISDFKLIFLIIFDFDKDPLMQVDGWHFG